jgi:biopolymer transport protein ExbD
MAKFRKNDKGDIPELNTSSLPDIIFMLLFFFMVATTMKETDTMVTMHYPQATEIKKLEKKSLVSFIYIGPPNQKYKAKLGSQPRIQLNDQFATPEDIQAYIASEREGMKEADRPKMTVSIKADKDTKMQIITDVKQALRKAQALKINYSARQGEVMN